MSLWRAMRAENSGLARALGQGDPGGSALLGSESASAASGGGGPMQGAVGGYGSRKLTPYRDVYVRGGATQGTSIATASGGRSTVIGTRTPTRIV